MIEFNCPNRKYDGTPVVCDLEVMAYAEAQVGDYKPELLKTPGKINVVHFVESYLEATIDMQDIYNIVPGMGINGITVFKDAMIPVCEDGETVNKFFPAGAIIIDSGVTEREEGLQLSMRAGISACTIRRSAVRTSWQQEARWIRSCAGAA